jgi:hypothetical protein
MSKYIVLLVWNLRLSRIKIRLKRSQALKYRPCASSLALKIETFRPSIEVMQIHLVLKPEKLDRWLVRLKWCNWWWVCEILAYVSMRINPVWTRQQLESFKPNWLSLKFSISFPAPLYKPHKPRLPHDLIERLFLITIGEVYFSSSSFWT